ncbi:DUF669 domain-containing protein [Sulfitobacter pacificus]|uniref:DUF669 domain-containing protein n=1 Tax=Sulfitobacter pacificus TaxID=1499314 RepID=UPI00310C029F
MANLGDTYDASNGETMETRDALPAGDYVAALVKSDKKGPNDKGNSYINCEFEVTDGEAKGRRFWTMLNLWNSNSQAVEIAQRELNSMMHACGKLRISDTEELHGIPMQIKLGVRTSDQYGAQNDVKGYKPLNAAPATQQSQQQQGDAQSGPWKSGQAA